MKTNFSVLFYMKKQKNYYDGPVSVYLRITVAGQRAELATARTCLPDDWNPQAGRAMGSRQEIKTFNAHLNDLQQKVYEAYRQLADAGDHFIYRISPIPV